MYPDFLKTFEVIPVHKKKSTLLGSNYIPVSVIPILLSKVEHLVHGRTILTVMTCYHNVSLVLYPNISLTQCDCRILKPTKKVHF